MKKDKDWFKPKRYPHIDLPVNITDRQKIESYILNKNNISKHSFLPFIHKTSLVRKFRKSYSITNGQCNSIGENKKKERVVSTKKRELYYASHLDSLIFSYYSQELSKKYETYLIENNLDDVVLAYRSIPIDPSNENSSNKCNIEFANDVFTLIKNRTENEFNVIAFDITSYFDNLDHAILRNTWMQVLNVDKLPKDHFNVFKNITRFSFIDIVDLFKYFQNQILTQKTNSKGEKSHVRKKKVSSLKFLRNQNAIAFCETGDFLKIKHKLIRPNKTITKNDTIIKRTFGIPQGSPISSVLANIYLINFDKKLKDFVVQHNGVYRRYSDDIVIIIPNEYRENSILFVQNEIKEYKLEIQNSKTQIFTFSRNQKRLICGQVFQQETNWNKNFIYLGFEFDGTTILLKNSSISGYYRKLKRHIARAHYYSVKHNKELFKRRFLKKFSYKGAKRTRRRIWNETLKEFVSLGVYNYGNFLTYAYKASKSMNDNKIKAQTKKHWNKINKLIKPEK